MNTKLWAFVSGVVLGAYFTSYAVPSVVTYTKPVEVAEAEEEPAKPMPQIAATSTQPLTPILRTPDTHITAMAKKYGQSEWLAREIMRCEGVAYAIAHDIPPSEARHYNYTDDGVLWSVDVGRWQINDHYHVAAAAALGLNIYDDYDNIEYGFYLLQKEGTQPWLASQYCWDA